MITAVQPFLLFSDKCLLLTRATNIRVENVDINGHNNFGESLIGATFYGCLRCTMPNWLKC